jgi:hypothetical protein
MEDSKEYEYEQADEFDIELLSMLNKCSYMFSNMILKTVATEHSRVKIVQYDEVMQGIDKDKWKKAIQEELIGMKTLGVFDEPEIVSKDINLISTKLILAHKIEEGRYKARLVGRGFEQIYGKDYWNTSSPVIRPQTLRLIIAVSVQRKYVRGQADISQAYLNSNVDILHLFIEVPQSYIDVIGISDKLKTALKSGKRIGLRIKRALYGLKQSSLMWYLKLKQTLNKNGYKSSETDPCLFYNTDIYICIYVDDLLFMGTKEKVDKFIKDLKKEFKIKEKSVDAFLGYMIAENDDSSVTLSHQKYIDHVLTRFKVPNIRYNDTPLENNINEYRAKEEGEMSLDTEKYAYRDVVGSLNYLSVTTRPDISYAVSLLSRHLESPTWRHWRGALRTMRYLNGTKDIGLKYNVAKCDEIIMYTDASYNNDAKGRGQNGYIITYAGSAIMWKSKRQTVTALSTTEAELDACTQGVVMLQQIESIAHEIGMKLKTPIVYTDSSSLISQVAKMNRKSGNRHLNTSFRYMCDMVHNKEILLQHVSKDVQIADICTKPLGPTLFIRLRDLIKMSTKKRIHKQYNQNRICLSIYQ